MRQRERVAEARKRGTQAGKTAASWVFDGNTTDATRAAVQQALVDGDDLARFNVNEPAWLSGEWAGESMNELLGDILHEPASDSDDFDADEKNVEIEDAYADAASTAFWREVERGAAVRTESK